MIAQLRGTIVHTSTQMVIVDVQGVGYAVYVSRHIHRIADTLHINNHHLRTGVNNGSTQLRNHFLPLCLASSRASA